jgi:hypothetical protein
VLPLRRRLLLLLQGLRQVVLHQRRLMHTQQQLEGQVAAEGRGWT